MTERPPVPLAPLRPPPAPPPPAPPVDVRNPERLNEVLAQLYDLPGLESVAWRVRLLAESAMVEDERRRAGLDAESPTGLHLVFTGPPGTGKTTVARLIGAVYCALGLLPSGHVVETERGDLVGEHVGETAQKATKALDRAMGGVLFIDEAYALTPPEAGNDFGREAVEVILKRMEDDRGKVAVVVAGYAQEMRRFLSSNPGLEQRFDRTIDFPQYSAEALTRIAQTMATGRHYTFEPGALDLLHHRLVTLVERPPEGWANARSVRRLLDNSIVAQHHRLAGLEGPHDVEALQDLTGDDVAAGIADSGFAESATDGGPS